MEYSWIEKYCSEKQGAILEYKQEWQATKCMVGNKMFALQGKDKTDRPIITLKLLPEDGYFLREQYEDITPGYYMNKEHWNSVYLDGSVESEIIKDMIDKSYQLIFDALPKKTKKEILG